MNAPILNPPLTALMTASGRYVDLLDPKPEDIDFHDIAEHLAKANRYCGATPNVTYSVAEHSVRAADACFADTCDVTLAAYVLCHDMHEAYLGDDITPKKRALSAIAIENYGDAGKLVFALHNMLAYRLDVAIHAAAGLPFPLPSDVQILVHRYDRMLLDTEWRDLIGRPRPWPETPGIVPLPDPIEPWGWETADARLRHRCQAWLPALQTIPGPGYGPHQGAPEIHEPASSDAAGAPQLAHGKSASEQGGAPC